MILLSFSYDVNQFAETRAQLCLDRKSQLRLCTLSLVYVGWCVLVHLATRCMCEIRYHMN